MKRLSILFAFFALVVALGDSAQAQCTGGYNCYLQISGQDGFGDGWNGASISFVQNGIQIGSFTIADGASGTSILRLCTDNGSVACSWSAGMYDDEISFTISDSLGVLLYECVDGSLLPTSAPFATVAPCPSCLAPRNIGAVVTTNTADLSWVEVGTASLWYYNLSASPVPDGPFLPTYTTSAEFTGLEANTEYYFFVYSDCGGGDSSVVSTFAFRTACGTTVLPLVENFDNNGNDIPNCWRVWETLSVSNYNFPYVTVDGHNYTKALSLYSNGGATSIVSPKMPLPANELEVRLWLSGGDALQVGYVTSNDLSTAVFHPVGTAGPTSMLGLYEYDWQEFSIPFDTVTCTDSIWVVLRRAQSLSNFELLVDDVTIRQRIDCSVPGGLALSNLTTSGQLTLSWSDPEGGGWQVAYGPHGFDPDTASVLVDVADTVVTLTGLEDRLYYDFYVRTRCGNLNGYWSNPVSGQPNLYVVDIPAATITSCSISIVDEGGIDGDYMYGTEQLITLHPADSGMGIRLRGSIDLGGGTYSPAKMRVFAGNDTTGMLLGNYINATVDNIDLASDVGAMTIWFKGTPSILYTAGGYHFYVSCIPLSGCTSPYNLSVSDIAGLTANVNWQYNSELGEANEFTLVVEDVAAGEIVQTIYIDGMNRSYILTGLEERTAYRLLLSVDCIGADTVEAYFSTTCSVGGEKQIGTGTSTSSYIPSYTYYGYALSQQLFLGSELGSVNKIYGFRFYQTTSNSTTRQLDIYMDTTALASYGTAADYVPQDMGHRYFSGEVSFRQGWVTVSFDSAFTVPEGANVILTVYDHTGSGVSSTSSRKTNTTSPMAVYAYRNNTAFAPSDGNALGSGQTANFRNTIVFLTECMETNCVPPIITEATPTDTSVMLEWLSILDEGAWRVEYRRSGVSAWTAFSVSTANTYCEVTGLEPATTYVIRVSSVCSDTVVGRTTTVTTLCGRSPLPFDEGFESFTAPSNTAETESCWFRASNYPGSTTHYPYRDIYDGYDSPYSMYFYGPRSRLVLPLMAAEVGNLSMTFYAKRGSVSNIGFQVGVCTDPEDTNTYVVVSTFSIDNPQVWTPYTVDFDSYSGSDGHIFFRSVDAGYDGDFNIDAIHIEAVPSCRNIARVNVTNVGASSIELAITDNSVHSAYTLLWSTSNDLSGATDSVTVTTLTGTIAGLASNTTYYVWVRGVCGSERGNAYEVGAVNTICAPLVVTDDSEYFTEIEQGLLCMWQKSEVGFVDWTTTSYNIEPHPYSGSRMLTLQSNQQAESMLVLPTFDFSQMSADAELSFYMNIASAGTSLPATLHIYYRLSENGPWQYVASADSTLFNQWKKYAFLLPSSQGAPVYQVGLLGRTNHNSYGVNVDNIKVGQASSCFSPSGVSVRNVTDRTATVSWVGGATAYKVQYRAEGNWQWNARTVEGIDTVTLSPLQAACNYEVRVVSLCSDEQSDPSVSVHFSTDLCSDRVEKNNYTAMQIPSSCTDGIGLTDAIYTYTEILIDSARLVGLDNIDGMVFSVTNAAGGSAYSNCKVYLGYTSVSSLVSFQYDSSFVMVYSGSMAFTAVGPRSVMFDNPFVHAGNGNLVVGILHTNPYYSGTVNTSVASHRYSDSKFCQGYYNSYTAPLTPDMANLLPAGNRTTSNNVPDITLVGCNPVCYEPVISRISTTASSITVDWYNENAEVEVAIKPAAEAVWDPAVTVYDAHSYTYTNLPGMTEYDLRLRRVCSIEDDDYSDWVTVRVTTDTACSIPTNVSVPEVSAHSALVGWTDGPIHGNRWEIRVWNSDVNLFYDVNTNPAVVSGLPSGAAYNVAVRAFCSADNHVVGDWSDPVGFDNLCPPVTHLQAFPDGNDIKLTWTAADRNQQWVVCWGYAGFDLNQQLGYMIVSTNSATIPGLNADQSSLPTKDVNVNYGFRVRAICGDDWNSGWSNEVTPSAVGIDDLGDASPDPHLSIYPNPTDGYATLQLGPYEGTAEITVLSVDGRQLVRFAAAAEQEPNATHLTLNTNHLALTPGTYFVRVQTAGWSAVRKLIVR